MWLCVCVYVCVCVWYNRERERESSLSDNEHTNERTHRSIYEHTNERTNQTNAPTNAPTTADTPTGEILTTVFAKAPASTRSWAVVGRILFLLQIYGGSVDDFTKDTHVELVVWSVGFCVQSLHTLASARIYGTCMVGDTYIFHYFPVESDRHIWNIVRLRCDSQYRGNRP